jgi:hypothetical protein
MLREQQYLFRTNEEIEYNILNFLAYQGIVKYTKDQSGKLGKLE